jgi:hypothetical protein
MLKNKAHLQSILIGGYYLGNAAEDGRAKEFSTWIYHKT